MRIIIPSSFLPLISTSRPQEASRIFHLFRPLFPIEFFLGKNQGAPVFFVATVATGVVNYSTPASFALAF